jgi:hypothetical protein
MVAGMKDAAQRKRDERQRMRKAGYVLRQMWVRPEDWRRVQNYLRRLNDAQRLETKSGSKQPTTI